MNTRDGHENLLRGKKGILVKNLLGLIIAAAAVFILSMLLFKLIAPPMDVERLTVESYMDSFRSAIDDVDKDGVGEFSVFVLPGNDKKYFLVYFGNKNLVDYFVKSGSATIYTDDDFASAAITGVAVGSGNYGYNMYYRFFLQKQMVNAVCICSNSESLFLKNCYDGVIDESLVGGNIDAYCDFNCKECVSLNWPIVFDGEAAVDLNLSKGILIRKGEGEDKKTKYFFEDV
jgi:hypothetical protein